MKRIAHIILILAAIVAATVPICASGPWALVKLSVANLRSEPSHKAELASQATMGTPLKVIARDGVWLKVTGPDDYTAWVNSSSVTSLTDSQFANWKKSRRLIAVCPFETHCYSRPDCSAPGCIVSDIVLGDIVQLKADSIDNNRIAIILPDGRQAWIDSDAVESFDSWSHRPLDTGSVLDIAQTLYGTPYLWGGTSTKGVDCSGLVRVAYMANGLLLRRDASQQARTGRRIHSADSLRRGDLIFFDNVGRGRVTHVGIYDRDGEYIHSSGRVGRNSLRPSSPRYLHSAVMGYVRISGCEGSEGIKRLCSHPWFF